MTDEMDAPQEVVLVDESGRDRTFRLHDALDVDGRTYYLVEASDDPEQVLLLGEIDGKLESVHGEELDRVIALLEAEDSSGG